MRRTFSALSLVVALSGCGTMGNSLPYHAGSLDDSMGMTIEQYAVGRLPARAHVRPGCTKPSERIGKMARAAAAKRCRTR